MVKLDPRIPLKTDNKVYSFVGKRRKKGEMEVSRRRGRRRKKLLDDLQDRRGYSHLKQGVLDRTMRRNRFEKRLWTCRQKEH
jgi:hypothetical protein